MIFRLVLLLLCTSVYADEPVYSSEITALQQERKTTKLNSNPGGHNSDIVVDGNDNEVTIQQVGPSGHYLLVDVNGSSNLIDTLQSSTSVGQRHYIETLITGNSNAAIIQQKETSKTAFVVVNGDYNSVTTNQKGTGNHYLNLSVSGNHHTADIIQDGSGNHAATVSLNGTQPWNFTLNQNSSTAQTYSLPHTHNGSTVSGSCFAVGGCNLTVNQP